MLIFQKIVLAGVLLFFLTSCGGEPAPEPPSAQPAPLAANSKELFSTSCSVCHRIEKAVNYNGDTSWKDIVDRMIQHNAKISPEEAAVIVKYLEETYPR